MPQVMMNYSCRFAVKHSLFENVTYTYTDAIWAPLLLSLKEIPSSAWPQHTSMLIVASTCVAISMQILYKAAFIAAFQWSDMLSRMH